MAEVADLLYVPNRGGKVYGVSISFRIQSATCLTFSDCLTSLVTV
jgi:hypothetical protein